MNRFDPNDLLEVPDPFDDKEAGELDLPPPPTAIPRAPTRSQARLVRLGSILAVAVCEILLVETMGPRDRASLPSSVLLYGVVVPILGALAVFVALQTSLSRRTRVLATILGGASLFLVMALFGRSPGGDFTTGLGRCLAGSTLMTAAPLLLALLSMRHSFASDARSRSAALGLASGLVGAASARLFCANDTFTHILIGHGLGILLVVVVATVLGPRFTRA